MGRHTALSSQHLIGDALHWVQGERDRNDNCRQKMHLSAQGARLAKHRTDLNNDT